MKLDLRKALDTGVLVGDGAMGTFLYQMGFPVGISYEELNLTAPEVIRDVHRRYVEAGAQVLETNTFSANFDKLSKYGLETKVSEINRAGVRIAREAAGANGYVIGAVGSIRSGKRTNVSTGELKKYFEQQVQAIVTEGVDGVLLETFYDVEELVLALSITRRLTDAPIICQFAVEDVARTLDGYTMPEAFRIVQQGGADVIGFNCRTGPNGIVSAMKTLGGHLPAPMSVYPNAGVADYVDGEYQYGAGPEYFGQMAIKFADLGSRIIGGCCGTTPAHIAAIAVALEDYVPQPIIYESIPEQTAPIVIHEDPEQPEQEEKREPNLVDLIKQRHTVIVELDPPRDLDIAKFLQGAERLKHAGADALTLADNSLAVTRMSNMALGHLVQVQTGLRPLVHIACRDRNLIGTQSHMMGFDALGIDHVLAVTGDPARFGDLPGSSSVYDLTSFEIIRMIKQLNEGIAFSGKPLKQKAQFVVGAAFNPHGKHLDKAVKRLERKIEAGADYIMTQPVYDPELIRAVKQATSHLDIPIFMGIMPLASGRNAEYLHNEVPGIQLSDDVRGRMSGLEGEEGRAVGVQIAKELLDVAMDNFNGIYLMTPFMLYEMSAQLIEHVWARSGRQLSPLYR
ncbi:bifunctional homocysteine S-methyltransferase/methylenetetrahydrofolate reductase [Paenibacillus sp.]|jgi:homocysteine S-methyltransferase|uniref:bifunctional homocysteine S-methyltransferase/methylenetetrahydrofolate reductase n=1 Tax=Paenibacillus sp. TaxID=58172 RepID=UPI002822FF07|nr:bifunctional homocysteine S-methyltransferase/methylenetetrahydrofolate reductase [Paenibacillus sp.]MDR0271059.1 bifunctional homocysteine S-methyltransferase/methylenetetrahydrofolate reductase [Paenibacillus sp.]